MSKFRRTDVRLSFMLAAGIIILCAGFFVVSCGSNGKSAQKTADSDVAACAFDCGSHPKGQKVFAFPQGNATNTVPTLEDKALTFEAWVKPYGTTGGIFGRYSGFGAALYFKNGVPSFGIGRRPVAGDVAATSKTPLTECVQTGVTTTECVVNAVSALGFNTAGVAATYITTVPSSTASLSIAAYESASMPTAVNSFAVSNGSIEIGGAGTAHAITTPMFTSTPLGISSHPSSTFVSVEDNAYNTAGFTTATSTLIRVTGYPTLGGTFTYVDPDPTAPDMGFTITLDTGRTARAIELASGTVFSAALSTSPDTWNNVTVGNVEDRWPVTVTTTTDHTAPNITNAWTHVAGVLTSEDQSTGPNNCAVDSDGNGTVQGAEVPHLAIYLNGMLNNCATSGGQYADNPDDQVATIGLVSSTSSKLDGLDAAGKFDAIIDDVRIWGYARSATQISTCMITELGLNGMCGRDDPFLAAYYRFNECHGADVTDLSGNAFNGSFEDTDLHHFETGWTFDHAPISRAD